jgi:hypothetical protein
VRFASAPTGSLGVKETINPVLELQDRCLSTSGARPDPAWLPTLIAQGMPIYCGYDADPTGDAMAQRMTFIPPSFVCVRQSKTGTISFVNSPPKVPLASP